MKAILLLAGYATRMYPLTEHQPKALLLIKGKPVIDYIVQQINRLPEVTTIYAVTNSRFYTHFLNWARASPTTIPIEVLDDGTTSNENRRGAIGDIIFTLQEKSINEDILVIAGDNYFTFDLREQYDFFKKQKADTIVAKEIDDMEQLKSFAVAQLDPLGKVLSLEEKPQQPKSNTAVFASYFYRKETLPLFHEYIKQGNPPDAPGYFPQWLHKIQDVYAYKMNGNCFDIGTIKVYEQLNKEETYGN
ncbi:MAG: nucleotidyltransferase family protein [Defluviitaleaceae bacterium]|nr:nucleotidyltransferase family protein [Defluviitaleaceae bacterium]